MYDVASQHNQLVINNLHPYRSYECSVAAVTIATGVYTLPIVIETPDDGKPS